jgi:broad specificity phosphatase PhoE
MTAWLADPSVAPPGGESFAQVSERVTAALHRVLAERGGQTVLIVSHVTLIKRWSRRPCSPRPPRSTGYT